MKKLLLATVAVLALGAFTAPSFAGSENAHGGNENANGGVGSGGQGQGGGQGTGAATGNGHSDPQTDHGNDG